MVITQRFRNAGWLAALLLLAAGTSSRAEWGNLSGQFVLDGDAPKANPVNVNKDENVCGKHNLVDESVTVNAENKGIHGIVLFLDVARGKKAPEAHPDYAKDAAAEVAIDNLNCRFEPHVVTLRTSQTLVIGNKDSVGHNTQVNTLKNPPINPIIPANQTLKQQFKMEERLPVKVACSIHPWMNALVVIKDTPYMAVSDKDGKFTINNLPVGKWDIVVWHEKSGYVDKANVGGKDEKWAKGKMEVEIVAGGKDLGTIKVPVALFTKK